MLKKLTIFLALLGLIPLASSWANKQIVVLETPDAGSNSMNVNYVFWLTTNNPVAHPGLQSRWSGASAGEIAAIQAGTVIEEVDSVKVSSGTDAASTNAIKTLLLNKFNARQRYFSQNPGPGIWYGIYYDSSTAWSQ